MNPSFQAVLGKTWYRGGGNAIYQAKERDKQKENPPKPEDEKELLVEQVVAKDTEEIAPVNSTCGGSNTKGAGHFSWEKFTHGVVSYALKLNCLGSPNIVADL